MRCHGIAIVGLVQKYENAEKWKVEAASYHRDLLHLESFLEHQEMERTCVRYKHYCIVTRSGKIL
jgi:hypothetical protein